MNAEINTDKLPEAISFALVAVMMLASGYLAGYLHGASQYVHSRPSFMLGFVMCASFAIPAIYIARRGDSR